MSEYYEAKREARDEAMREWANDSDDFLTEDDFLEMLLEGKFDNAVIERMKNIQKAEILPNHPKPDR